MDPQRIRMSAGGERLEEVMRREEEVELPKFEPGSFQIESGRGGGGEAGGRIVTEEVLNRVVPRGVISSHTMRDLISSIQIVGPGDLQCSQVSFPISPPGISAFVAAIRFKMAWTTLIPSMGALKSSKDVKYSSYRRSLVSHLSNFLMMILNSDSL